MWAGELYRFIKSKAVDEIVIVCNWEAVPVDVEVVDLGQYHPLDIFHQGNIQFYSLLFDSSLNVKHFK